LPSARGLCVALLLGGASALRLPSKAVVPSSAGAVTRRDVATAAAGLLGAFALPLAAPAFDTIPTVDADFAKTEKERAERAAISKAKTKEINNFIRAIETAEDKGKFIEACDKYAVWVIGEGKFPEGVPIKPMVARIRDAYEDLPKKKFRCPPTRDNNGICYSPGQDAEEAYEALIKQIRKYSLILVGDYRTVTFKAF